MGSWPVIKDLIGFCFLLFFHPEMLLADGWTTIETPQPWCKIEGRPHHPTWTPHPSLFELKETTFFVPESHQTILLHPITPHVSLVSCQFPRLEASQNTCLGSGDHYPSLIIMFLFFPFVYRSVKVFFSCKVQALEEFILFSLELVRKNYEKRSVEWGGVRTGWDERIIGTNLFS